MKTLSLFTLQNFQMMWIHTQKKKVAQQAPSQHGTETGRERDAVLTFRWMLTYVLNMCWFHMMHVCYHVDRPCNNFIFFLHLLVHLLCISLCTSTWIVGWFVDLFFCWKTFLLKKLLHQFKTGMSERTNVKYIWIKQWVLTLFLSKVFVNTVFFWN